MCNYLFYFKGLVSLFSIRVNLIHLGGARNVIVACSIYNYSKFDLKIFTPTRTPKILRLRLLWRRHFLENCEIIHALLYFLEKPRFYLRKSAVHFLFVIIVVFYNFWWNHVFVELNGYVALGCSRCSNKLLWYVEAFQCNVWIRRGQISEPSVELTVPIMGGGG